MTVNHRKLKLITFTLGGNSFECQVNKWMMNNNSDDGEKMYAFCPDGEIREDAEPDYALDITFFADWRVNGVSDYLTVNDQATVAFVLDHYPDIPAEHVRWSGNCKIKAPSVGGEPRTTEMNEVTLPVIGKPTYVHL
jgi:hypothetical protein